MEERRPSLKCINCLNGYAVSDRPEGQDIERESIEFFDKGYRKREAISWQK